MQKIHLWSVALSGDGSSEATPVETIDNTDTERRLEDLLVSSPELLMNDLTLVGRQVVTQGGPLDLLGIDQDGRVVIFEIKRGTLTRDAVAQVLDYASDLGNQDAETLARLVEENSGRNGIEELSDFQDWYSQEYPNSPGVLAERPRMVLVGLGVDERARRIVTFLADSGIDIQLLTFHAFLKDGNVLLARQVETEAPVAPRERSSKEENRRALHELAQAQGAKVLLAQVATFVDAKLAAYRWPGKTAYSFSLPEETQEGRPTLRSYLTVYVNTKERGMLTLSFPPRATEGISEAVDRFCASVATATRDKNSYTSLEVSITESDWSTVSPLLGALLDDIVAARQATRVK